VKISTEYKDYIDHFSLGISEEIEKYATNKVFKHYIFTWRQGKHQFGYCTRCLSNFNSDRFKHNSREQCLICGSKCTVKASGISRKKMVDEAYFVYYEKSLINRQSIVARGIYAVRDYRLGYHNVKTQYLVKALYIFEMSNSVMLIDGFGYYSMAGTMKSFELQKTKSVFSLCGGYINKSLNVITDCHFKSIAKVVKDTPFRFSTWESYKHGDMVKFFDLYSKYPCIEYLTKLGFSSLVESKLAGFRTYSAINWRGKTLFEVLRINKKEIKEIQSRKIDITFELLKLLQISKKDGSNLSPTEVSGINNPEYYLNYLHDALKYTSLRKSVSYIDKQRDKQSKHYITKQQVLIAWRDYINDCINLEMDLKKERILFPRNLYRAHQNTIKQLKINADETINKKIMDMAKSSHKKYYFEYQGLLIRPAQSAYELIAEGKALEHCIGTYAKRYASGENVLLFIRKISDPDNPFFTVEIIGSCVIQVHGFANCNPDEQVTEFVEAFKKEKLR
jgi:hypothetical protein